MKTNAGKADRVIRIVIGVVLLSLTAWGPQTAWGYIGFIPLATGLLGYCPLYSILGFSTCPLSGKSPQ